MASTTATNCAQEVIRQMYAVSAAVRDGTDVQYATDSLRDAVDEFLVVVGAESEGGMRQAA
jgi:hypothetical protein